MFDKKEYVYAVYKEKSFTAAAAKLYVSQPCLSAAIKKIEQQIGRPLFERRTGDLTPTKIGYEYIACAEKMMAVEAAFAQMLEDVQTMKAGEIRGGGTNYVCSYVLPQIVGEFSQQYPNVDVTIYEANCNHFFIGKIHLGAVHILNTMQLFFQKLAETFAG